tara:strand:- start:7177 stop:8151 length:975 start_codon:yes stop_codon:yes gene_type:complete
MLKIIRSDILKLLAWFLGSLIIGAALAPFLYHGCKAIVQFRVLGSFGDAGLWLQSKLDNAHFGRYFNRSMLLGALVCLYPLIRSLKLKKAHLGLEKNSNRFSELGIGFILAAGVLFIFGIVYFQMGIFERTNSFSFRIILKFIISAITVSLIEEYLFRGFLFGAVKRTASTFSTLLFISFFFAIIHFLKPPLNCARLADSDIHYFGTGFWTVGQIFAQFENPIFIAKGFATLFVVGLVLGWARIKTSSLWLSIGLHAGWVFSVKIYDYHSNIPTRYDKNFLLPYIGTDLKEGLIPLLGVLLTGILAILWIAIRQKNLLRDNKES